MLTLLPKIRHLRHVWLSLLFGLSLVPQSAIADDLRSTIDLNGHWRIAAISDTSGNSWQTIDVPSRLSHEGSYSLRKRFEVQGPGIRSHVWILSEDGIGGAAAIFLNGREVTSDAGGGISRQILLPAKFLREGINEIDIQIANFQNPRGTIPLYPAPLAADYSTGILGSIRLYKCGTAALLSCDLLPNALDQTVEVRAVAAFAEIPVEGFTVRSLVYDHQSGAIVSGEESAPCTAKPGGTCEIDFTVKTASMRNWSPQDPSQIDLLLTLDSDTTTIDAYKLSTGFRSLAIAQKHSILLNGTPLQFQGIQYVEPRGSTEEVIRSMIDHDLNQIQALGANTLRLPMPPSQYLLQRCDDLGILVMLDLPISGTPGHLLADEEYLKKAEILAASYLRAYGNHPCFVALGLGSDNDDADSRTQQFYTNLEKSCRSREPIGIHLYYFTSHFPSVQFALDFAALSTVGVQNDNVAHAAIDAFQAAHRGNVPYLLLGSGRLVAYDTHNDNDTNFVGSDWSLRSEARDLYLIERQTQHLEFAGSILATFRDYRSGLPQLMVRNSDHFLVTAGLENESGIERPAFKMVQALFHNAKTPNVNAVEDPRESTIPFLIYAFILALIFFILINLDRRFREYVNRALVRPFNFFADIRDQRLIPNAQSLLLALLVGGSLATVFAGLVFGFRETYTASWILRMLVHSPFLLESITSLAWSPWMLLLCTTAAFTAVLFVLAGIIRLAAIFVRQRIFYNDTLNVTVWALMPSILLLPLGLLLPRLEPNAATLSVTLWVLLVLKLWLLYRLMKGVGVLFDIYPTKIYLYCGTGIAMLYFLILFYMNFRYALFSNWDFVLHLSKA